jgi:hypothetical protein
MCRRFYVRICKSLGRVSPLWEATRGNDPGVVLKMRKAWLFVPILLVLCSTPAFAQGEKKTGPKEGDPVVGEANVRLQPGQDGIDVTEQIALENAEGLQEVEHVFTRFGDAGAEDLIVTAEGEELELDYQEGDRVDKVIFPLPEGTTGDFSYEVSYRYPESGDSVKVPLVVPAVPTVGDYDRVAFELTLPEGRYLHSSFPVISESSGTVDTSMISFPNYSSFELGTSPIGIFTPSNIYTVVGIALILGLTVAPLVYERISAKRRVSTNV